MCFASYACVCSTGYYRITEDMPAVNPSLVGLSINPSVLEKFSGKSSIADGAVTSSSNTGSSDDDDKGILWIIIGGSAAVLILIVVGVIWFIK